MIHANTFFSPRSHTEESTNLTINLTKNCATSRRLATGTELLNNICSQRDIVPATLCSYVADGPQGRCCWHGSCTCSRCWSWVRSFHKPGHYPLPQTHTAWTTLDGRHARCLKYSINRFTAGQKFYVQVSEIREVSVTPVRFVQYLVNGSALSLHLMDFTEQYLVPCLVEWRYRL